MSETNANDWGRFGLVPKAPPPPVAAAEPSADWGKFGLVPKPAVAAPEPAPRGGVLRNIGAGMVDAGAGLLNTLSDPFGNLVGKPLATGIQFAHDAIAPMFGGKPFPANVRNELLGDTVPQIGTRAVDALADVTGTPRAATIPADTEGERLARKLTTGTMMGAAFAPPVLGAVAGAGGTLVGDVAGQVAPEWAAPMAELVGNVAGGATAGATAYGAQRGFQGLKNQVGLMGIGKPAEIAAGIEGAPTVTEAQANRSARMLRDATGEQLPAMREALGPGVGPDGAGPGMPLTTAQMTAGNPTGLPLSRAAGLEQSARIRDQAPFVDIQRQQRDAMARGLSGMKPATFDPDGLANFFVSQLDDLTRNADATIAGADRGVRSATAAIGNVVEPALVGQEARKATTEALAPVRANEGRLWRKLEENPDLALNIDPLRETAGMLRQELVDRAHVSGAPNSKVDDLLQKATALPNVASYRDLIELRKYAGDLGRQLSPGESLSTTDMRRVTMVKEAIDTSIKKAVAEAATDNPEFAAAIQSEIEQHNANLRASQGDAGPQNAGGAAGSGMGDVPPQSGNQGAGGRQPGNGAGDRGLAAGSADGSGAIPTMVIRPGRQAESLTDFLISKGGVRDEGGELAAGDLQSVHHRAGGRLVNPNGLPHDYAREAAVEAGFLKPDATVNDFRDAVKSRQPVYRISEAADAAARNTMDRQGRLTDNARFEYGANVEDAAAAGGVKLSKVEVEHATDLAMQGVHPDQAIRDAVAFSEEMAGQRNAERNAVGAPGVPLAAQQAEMPVDTRPRLVPNLTAEDAATYGAARSATAEKHRVFGEGPVGQMMERGRNSPYRTADADVGKIFSHNNPTAVGDYNGLVEAVGKARADSLVQQFLVNDLKERGNIIQPDGTVNVRNFQNWQSGPRGRVIDQIPGLREKFANAEAAQETLTAAEAAKSDVINRYRKSIKGRFLPPESADIPLAQSEVVSQVLSGPSSGPAFRRLVQEAGKNPTAIASLKADVADYLTNRFTNMDEVGPSAMTDFTKAETFRNWVNEHKGPLKALYGGQGVQTIEQIAAAIRRARAVKVEGEGSPTARYLQQSERLGLAAAQMGGLPLVGALGYMAAETVAAGAGKIPILGTAWYAARQAGLESAKDLLAFSMAHPSVARELMVRIGPDGKIGPVAQRRIGAAIMSAVAADRQTKPAEEPKQ